MVYRIAPFMIVMTLLSGCGIGFFQTTKRRVLDTAELSRAIIIYSEKLAQDHHLRLEDSVVYYDRRINRIRLDYTSMDNLDLWQARALLVDLVEGFLGTINGNTEIVNSLAAIPLTPNQLEVYIRFISYYNIYVDLQTVGLITLRGGIANYFASDALDCDTECWHRRSEYYFQSKNFTEAKIEGEAIFSAPPDLSGSAFKGERFVPLDSPLSHQSMIVR